MWLKILERKVKVSGMLMRYCLKFARDCDNRRAHSSLKDPLEKRNGLRRIPGLCSFGNPYRARVVVEVGYRIQQLEPSLNLDLSSAYLTRDCRILLSVYLLVSVWRS